eukprot:gene33815-39425_t
MDQPMNLFQKQYVAMFRIEITQSQTDFSNFLTFGFF